VSTYRLGVVIGPNPATGVTLGQIVNAYKASRFTDPTTAPATNTAAPGDGPGGAGDHSADYGPVTTDCGDPAVTFVAPQFTVTSFEPFMVAYYDPADTSNGGTFNVYWI
jgi:hypothetical protein